MTNLFRHGEFTSHSGLTLPWRIECDALGADDWYCLARMVRDKYEFREVVGVSRGGLPFAKALATMLTPGADTALIVDDVMTTGASFEEAWTDLHRGGLGYAGTRVVGVCVFARARALSTMPGWVQPLFTFWDR